MGYVQNSYSLKFGVNGLSKIDGGELAISARRVGRVAIGFFDDLNKHGLNQEMLDTLNTECKAYEKSLEKQEDAIANRDIASEDRMEQANAIYDTIISYCSVGRKIWKDSNEAMYNDYIIYDSVTSNNKADNTAE